MKKVKLNQTNKSENKSDIYGEKKDNNYEYDLPELLDDDNF